ncbi:MAG: hypothetical protein CMIDDMOC_00881 [Sodalis sp. Fle]|nr:MAG: hypothetical protein CMIDDMOC_00881 [Sodalis sp. Fle]
MMLSKIIGYAGKGFHVFFPLFLFLSAIFCGYTRVNNLFHLSLLCMLFMLVGDSTLRHQLFDDYRFNTGLVLAALMLGYFCLTTLWSCYHLRSLISYIMHSLYLLLFILMFRLISLQGRRMTALGAVAAGITVLVLLTFWFVDKQTLLTNRMEKGFFGAPENVIDLAGYFSLGIFLYLIMIRQTGYGWLYLPVVVLLLAILFTQSRGPLLALSCALAVLFLFQPAMKQRYLLIMMFVVLVLLALLLMTRFGDIFLLRIESGYQQSFIRFGIWRHSLELVVQKPVFGWGLDKELSFINKLGDLITTTHSLYLASLLKGGIVGLLLLTLLILYGMLMAKRQLDHKQGLESALFLFTSVFYVTQGMFIISNPEICWEMFWFPLAVVLTLPTSLSDDGDAKLSY